MGESLLTTDSLAFVAAVFIHCEITDWQTKLLNAFSMTSFELFSES